MLLFENVQEIKQKLRIKKNMQAVKEPDILSCKEKKRKCPRKVVLSYILCVFLVF